MAWRAQRLRCACSRLEALSQYCPRWLARPVAGQVYARVKDPAALVPLFESYLEEYNANSTSPMKLVMFLDAIEHVSRLCRRAA